MKVPKYVAVQLPVDGSIRYAVAELTDWDMVHKPVAWADNASQAKRLATMASEGAEAREARLRKRRAAEKRRARTR